MAKKLKSAAEIAEFIRQALKEPELRVAVYSGPHKSLRRVFRHEGLFSGFDASHHYS